MKRIFALFLLLGSFGAQAQVQYERMILRKGVILDSLPVEDGVASQLKLYLPRDFDTTRTWPLIFICAENEKAIQTMRSLVFAAEKNGYILATTEAVRDTLPLTDKILTINASLKTLREYLPLNLRRIYTSGYDLGGQLATLVPSLIKPVRGVFSIGAGLSTPELIGDAGTFEFVGVMGRADYQYSDLRAAEEFLDRKKIRNHVLYHPGGHEWPQGRYTDLGMQILTLMTMKDPGAEKDTAFIKSSYQDFKDYILALEESGDLLLALDQVEEGESLFEGLYSTDWLKEKRKELRKNRTYRAQKRDWEQVLVQELILNEDYAFYLAEDVNSFNLNNLGWWNYQMEKIDKYKNSDKGEERLMGQRLEGYLNALISDFIDSYGLGEKPDEDALILLHMLKTITAPQEYDHYLKVISYTAKYGDFGTANFYLEELLKRGYTDADQLYSLPHTGLLRISPEFNKLVEQYLGEARYATEE
jgi:hypothetical protein